MDCRRHNHQGNKGVCPSCLRDKLSLLPNTPSYYIIYRSDQSNSTTASSSPVMKDHRRTGSMSLPFDVITGGDLGGGLRKSRSMAHVKKDYLDPKKKKTTEKLKSRTVKKIGFWSKLFHLKPKCGGADVDGLLTSRQRVY